MYGEWGLVSILQTYFHSSSIHVEDLGPMSFSIIIIINGAGNKDCARGPLHC